MLSMAAAALVVRTYNSYRLSCIRALPVNLLKQELWVCACMLVCLCIKMCLCVLTCTVKRAQLFMLY